MGVRVSALMEPIRLNTHRGRKDIAASLKMPTGCHTARTTTLALSVMERLQAPPEEEELRLADLNAHTDVQQSLLAKQGSTQTTIPLQAAAGRGGAAVGGPQLGGDAHAERRCLGRLLGLGLLRPRRPAGARLQVESSVADNVNFVTRLIMRLGIRMPGCETPRVVLSGGDAFTKAACRARPSGVDAGTWRYRHGRGRA